jgi:TonB-linked SusC/RagA family outer membrane protein
MKKLIVLIASMLLLGIGSLYAQTREVSGTVVDESGLGLPGVSVSIVGTTVGASTDMDGKWSLTVSDKDVLEFSFMGMITQKIKVGKQKVIKVTLKENRVMVEEVVVTGYGVQKKSSFTGSAAVVSSEKLAASQQANPLQALQGAVSGVQVFNSSGQPGSSPTIRIRGISSINGSKEPLIVVDGMIYPGSLSNISASDIESQTVLKDAAATALYGARGGNGVIVITTKQGKDGQINAQITASVGFSERGIPEYDRVGRVDWYQYAWEGLRNNALDSKKANPGLWASENLISVVGTNCYKLPKGEYLVNPSTGLLNPNAKLLFDDNLEDALYRTGIKQEYGASVRGGFKNTKFYMSVGRVDQQGILNDSDYERNNARINVDTKINKYIKTGFNLSVTESTSSFTKQDHGSVGAVFTTMRNQAPIYSLYLRDHATGKIIYDQYGNPKLDYGSGENGEYDKKYDSKTNVLSKHLDPRQRNRNSYLGKFYLQFEPMKGLMAKIVYSKNRSNSDYLSYTNMLYGNGRHIGGGTTREYTKSNTESFKQFISYSKDLQGHSFNVTAVHENYLYTSNSMDGRKEGFPVPGIMEFKAAANIKSLDSYGDEYATEAYLLKGNWEYKGKYYANASYRREGSSRFSSDNRWGDFWAVGLAWRLTAEDFMQNISWLDNARLKLSYGTNGNDNFIFSDGTANFYPYQAEFATGKNNAAFAGARINGFANKKLTWEKQCKFNTGIDFTVLGGLIDAQVEYFHNTTNDLLFNRPIPGSSGLSVIAKNIGSMVNYGMEYTVNIHPLRDEFRWDVSLNLTHYKNEVTELAENMIRHGNMAYQVGKSAYEFYMYESAGINPETGNYLWYKDIYKKDKKGNILKDKYENKIIDHKEKTENANEATEKWLGTSLPDCSGGISNVFSYKGLSLRMDLSYSIGGKLIDYAYSGLMHRGGFESGVAWHKDIKDRWQKKGDKTDVARLIYKSKQTGVGNQDRYMVDASYLNFNNVSLSYELPKSLIEQFGLNRVSFSVSAENIAQFSHRKGLNATANMTGGTTRDYYSLLRTISFGTVINF